jgi:twitching motility two-component system response regulator PilG
VNDSLPLAGTKVVLIDDSNTIRRSGDIFLSQAGCLVVLAEDGLDGLCKVADTRPDIVLMDIMMPRLDGYQACALLKNQRAYAETPVIMLSSRDSLFDHARSRLAGAAQYLLKPFNKQSLIAAVSAQLQHTQGASHE